MQPWKLVGCHHTLPAVDQLGTLTQVLALGHRTLLLPERGPPL